MTYEELALTISKLSDSDKKKRVIASDYSGVTEYIAVVSGIRKPDIEDDLRYFPQLEIRQISLT